MLSGDNGILQKATDAKTGTVIGQETEALSLAWNSCIIDKTTQDETITTTKLKNSIQNNGYNNVDVTKSGDKFKVTFESGNVYTVKDDGTIKKYEKVEPTAIYAKLYTDGTLILSSTDYTDTTRTVAENGNYGDVSQKTEFYANAGGTLVGDYPGWIDENISYPANEKINSVIIKDIIAPTSTSFWFSGCSNLTSIQGLDNLDTSNVSDMSDMFNFCLSLTSLDLSNFDTSKTTNMAEMFRVCNKLTSLNVSSFNTSEVTNMCEMFSGCEQLLDINVSSFNTNKVTDMRGMFSSCEQLLDIDVSSFNTSKVTDMRNMFAACGALEILDLSNFDTSKVTNMSDMFRSGNHIINGVRYGEFVARVIIGSNWNPAMTESATGYNGTFEVKNN